VWLEVWLLLFLLMWMLVLLVFDSLLSASFGFANIDPFAF
jgi:hypothetical protein